jgi:monofunctional biosynthetic peptidoglycan transglycosylase
MKLLKKTVTLFWRLLLAYAVVFSLSATIITAIVGYQLAKPLLQVRALRTENPRYTSYMKEVVRTQFNGDYSKLQHRFVPLDSISPWLSKAVLAAEDDGFWVHPGFDIAAIIAANQYNRKHNNIRHGGSTITQQMAKNLFLSNRRSFSRKYSELVYAVLMERILGKKRILELYLNYAQWGPDIFGCEAASQHYFDKSAKKLTLNESARMAAVLAMPSRLSPLRSSSGFMGKRLHVIAQNLYLGSSIDASTHQQLSGTLPQGYPEQPDSLQTTADSSEQISDSEDEPQAEPSAQN